MFVARLCPSFHLFFHSSFSSMVFCNDNSHLQNFDFFLSYSHSLFILFVISTSFPSLIPIHTTFIFLPPSRLAHPFHPSLPLHLSHLRFPSIQPLSLSLSLPVSIFVISLSSIPVIPISIYTKFSFSHSVPFYHILVINTFFPSLIPTQLSLLKFLHSLTLLFPSAQNPDCLRVMQSFSFSLSHSHSVPLLSSIILLNLYNLYLSLIPHVKHSRSLSFPSAQDPDCLQV